LYVWKRFPCDPVPLRVIHSKSSPARPGPALLKANPPVHFRSHTIRTMCIMANIYIYIYVCMYPRAGPQAAVSPAAVGTTHGPAGRRRRPASARAGAAAAAGWRRRTLAPEPGCRGPCSTGTGWRPAGCRRSGSESFIRVSESFIRVSESFIRVSEGSVTGRSLRRSGRF
jgi:hypothetical protein